MLDGSLKSALVQLETALRQVVQRPEVAGVLAEDLDQVFSALRNHVWFLDYQRQRLGELLAELERL